MPNFIALLIWVLGHDNRKVYLGDDKACNIIGRGDVRLSLPNGGTWLLTDVRHIPSLKRNLISVSQLISSGHITTFTRNVCKVTKVTLVIAYEKKEGTLYLTWKHGSINVVETSVNSDTWHCRLGHISEKGMKILHSKCKLLGLKVLDLKFCEDCISGKQKKISFSKV